jgi:hypothetical protein
MEIIFWLFLEHDPPHNNRHHKVQHFFPEYLCSSQVLCVNLLRPTRQHYYYYLIQGKETKAHDSEEAAPILQPGIDAEGHENSQCLQVLYSEFPCCALVINQLFCTL